MCPLEISLIFTNIKINLAGFTEASSLTWRILDIKLINVFRWVSVFYTDSFFFFRGMPLHRTHDRSSKWRCMEEDDSIFVYREGTLEQTTYNLYHFNKPNSSRNGYSSIVIREKGNNTPVSCFVPLKDIIVWLEKCLDTCSINTMPVRLTFLSWYWYNPKLFFRDFFFKQW